VLLVVSFWSFKSAFTAKFNVQPLTPLGLLLEFVSILHLGKHHSLPIPQDALFCLIFRAILTEPSLTALQYPSSLSLAPRQYRFLGNSLSMPFYDPEQTP